MQWKASEHYINGKLNGEGIEATITDPIIPTPLSFTGQKKG
jgi:hypothetical protein